jgi:hypothetical protein
MSADHMTAISRTDLGIDEIDDQLFVGTEAAAVDAKVLRAHGIAHIVKLNENDGKACFPELFQYFIVNLRDRAFEALDQKFCDPLKFVRSAIDAGGRVFLHCLRGISHLPWLIRTCGSEGPSST